MVVFFKVWAGLGCSKSFFLYTEQKFHVFNRSGKARVDLKAFRVESA